MGTMSVPSKALCLTLEGEMGIFGFGTERDWNQKIYYGSSTEGVICFLCDGHLWCQVSRTLHLPQVKETLFLTDILCQNILFHSS